MHMPFCDIFITLFYLKGCLFYLKGCYDALKGKLLSLTPWIIGVVMVLEVIIITCQDISKLNLMKMKSAGEMLYFLKKK